MKDFETKELEENCGDFSDYEFNLFDSIKRGLERVIEYARTHNTNQAIKLEIKENNE